MATYRRECSDAGDPLGRVGCLEAVPGEPGAVDYYLVPRVALVEPRSRAVHEFDGRASIRSLGVGDINCRRGDGMCRTVRMGRLRNDGWESDGEKYHDTMGRPRDGRRKEYLTVSRRSWVFFPPRGCSWYDSQCSMSRHVVFLPLDSASREDEVPHLLDPDESGCGDACTTRRGCPVLHVTRTACWRSTDRDDADGKDERFEDDLGGARVDQKKHACLYKYTWVFYR